MSNSQRVWNSVMWGEGMTNENASWTSYLLSFTQHFPNWKGWTWNLIELTKSKSAIWPLTFWNEVKVDLTNENAS